MGTTRHTRGHASDNVPPGRHHLQSVPLVRSSDGRRAPWERRVPRLAYGPQNDSARYLKHQLAIMYKGWAARGSILPIRVAPITPPLSSGSRHTVARNRCRPPLCLPLDTLDGLLERHQHEAINHIICRELTNLYRPSSSEMDV